MGTTSSWAAYLVNNQLYCSDSANWREGLSTISIADKRFKSLIKLPYSRALTICNFSRMSNGIWGIGEFQYDGYPILGSRLQILEEYAHTSEHNQRFH